MKEKGNIISKVIEADKDIDHIVKNQVRRYVGNSVYLGEKFEREDYKIYQLGMTSMDYIKDLEKGTTTTWFEDFDNVSKIKVNIKPKNNNHLKIEIEIPDREQIQEEFIDKKKINAMKAERKLVEIIYSQISEIPEVRLSFNAIIEILNYICEYEEIDKKTIKAYRNNTQANKYIMFLKTYDYLEEGSEKDIFYPGKELTNLQSIPNGGLKPENEKSIIKDLLKRGYSYIINELNLKHVIPYSRLSNSYYLSSVESDSMIKMDEDYLRDRMKDIYQQSRKKNKMKILKHLNDLDEVGIINKDKNLIYGQDKVYEGFSKKISKNFKQA